MAKDREPKGIDIETLANLGIEELSCALSALMTISYNSSKVAAEAIPSMYLAFSEGLLHGKQETLDADQLNKLTEKYYNQLPKSQKKELLGTYNNACIQFARKLGGSNDIATTLLYFPGLARDLEICAMLARKDLPETNREFLQNIAALEITSQTATTFVTTEVYSLCRKLGEAVHDKLKASGIFGSRVGNVLEAVMMGSIASAEIAQEAISISTKPIAYMAMAKAAFCGGLIQGFSSPKTSLEKGELDKLTQKAYSQSSGLSPLKDLQKAYEGSAKYLKNIEEALKKPDGILNLAKQNTHKNIYEFQREKTLKADVYLKPQDKMALDRIRAAVWAVDGTVASNSYKAGMATAETILHPKETASNVGKSIYNTVYNAASNAASYVMKNSSEGNNKRHLPPSVKKKILKAQQEALDNPNGNKKKSGRNL
jgi:hypothetical protein